MSDSKADKVEQKGVDFNWGVKIQVRDGIKLNATVYKPFGMKEPLPVIFTFTPYIADRFHEWGMYFAKNEYVFAAVDVRGRGNSEGHLEPMVNEGKDGHDVVEWFAKQPWCNGKVTMFGGSYGGFDQWSTLKEFPTHLATILPVASGHPSVDFPWPKNIKASYFIQWMTFTSGVTANGNIFGDSELWNQAFYRMYKEHLPFNTLDKIVGNMSTHFQTWMQHPIPDAYYDAMNPTESDYAKMQCPILTITGHYDGDQNGAMRFYKNHMKYGNPNCTKEHYLLIGPWDHGGTRHPQRHVAGLDFGEPSMINMDKLNKDWYDHGMKGKGVPEFLKKRVTYYVMGPNVWKYADSLEDIPSTPKCVYLSSDNGKANDVFKSGSLLMEKPGNIKPDSYVYDPLDTRPGELELKPNPNSNTDQTYALNLFGNGLVYHTEPFEKDIEITGYVKLNAWISMDVPDTDIIASFSEITRDGGSVNLSQDFVRARYRESLRQENLIKPGEINLYTFDAFTFFSRVIAEGSRLRLVISCPNSIQLEKNYNSSKPVAEQSGADAKTAHITLYHDATHPSCLEIPFVFEDMEAAKDVSAGEAPKEKKDLSDNL
jgi:uncharacterized protein